MKDQMHSPHLLKLVDYHDSILRQTMEPVQFPLSKEDKKLIKDMKFSIQKKQLKKANACWESAAGMAANQWGIRKRIFLFCPFGSEDNAQVVINPSYEPLPNLSLLQPMEEEDLESCFSVPLAVGNIRRYIRIRATSQNDQGEFITQELTGRIARVWQHETDHLNGLLYDDPTTGRCLYKKEFASKEMVEDFYRNPKGF